MDAAVQLSHPSQWPSQGEAVQRLTHRIPLHGQPLLLTLRGAMKAVPEPPKVRSSKFFLKVNGERLPDSSRCILRRL